MFGIRGWLARHFGGLKEVFKWLGSQANQEKVAKEIGVALNLTKVVAPFVAEIASFFNGDDTAIATREVLAAADRIGVKVEDVLNEPDWHRKIGLSLDLAGESLREKLRSVLPTLDHGLEIEGKIVTTIEQLDALPSNVFHTPAQLAVRALRTVGDAGEFARAAIADMGDQSGG